MMVNKALSEKVGKIISKIESQLDIGEEKRADGVSDEALVFMKKKLSEMRNALDMDQLSGHRKKYADLSRRIVDSWPFSSEVGKEISEVDHEYVQLLKARNLI